MMFTGLESQIYSFETWPSFPKYPSKDYVLETIRKWKCYSHGVRLNEVIFNEHGKPKGKRVKMFYLPKDTGELVEFAANLSISGYRTYVISNDILGGIYFVKDKNHQTDIDADLIQALIDHSDKVRCSQFRDIDTR